VHPWLLLLLAGLAEIGWVIGLKYSEGFNRTPPSILTLSLMGLSMWMLGSATKTLPIGTAYAVWTGVGAAGAAIAGIFLFQESAAPLRLACIAIIIAGVVGLKLTTPG
jgi:quaternary ammonium compound-resistance protein SugE